MRLRLGIIGGGQLGRYLCAAARELGIVTVVMTDEAEPPAAATADRVIHGGLGDLAAARTLVEAVDVVTFEIEAVGADVLDLLADADARGRVAVRPGAGILATLRNKATQKRWLVDAGLPTAPFRAFNDASVRLTAADLDGFAMPVVQKSQVGGYDGRGVHIVHGLADLDEQLPGPCLLEAFVPHVGEFAILVARGVDGDIRCYDPVALRFEPRRHVLDEVRVPAGLSEAEVATCRALAVRCMERLGGVGVFALELFLTPHGEIVINEISPRVHNAGHLTLEACATSQFEQHVRAVAGLPLGPVALQAPAVMRNLLWRGPPAPAVPVPVRLAGSTAHIYWYDKSEGRPWRKMGHLTACGPTVEVAGREAEAGCAAVLAFTDGACG
ncbi:MAG: ATP-grasp domain-containing protein [Pseudomonadales bacterium]|nr:ATP-grasp domain-containing protein [Pseudomonadales bacterium]